MRESSNISHTSARVRSEVGKDGGGPRGELKRAKKFFQALSGIIAAFVLFKLLAYRSSEPWIFGIYSLPYFVFLVFSVGTIFFVGFLFYRFGLKAFYLLLGSIIGLALSLTAIELGGQLYAFLHPSYRVLSFVPDRVVGWKLAPNLHFTWGGQYWYAREFTVPVQTNALGFRDVEHTFAKPQGVTRVALLGDSMVEAFQVPFGKTAAHLLEQNLNAGKSSAKTAPAKYEVLNFGVSNYGVGQYLLTWEQYASKFSPDYVLIFVSEMHMDRTVRKYEPSAFATIRNRLWVRPTFRLEAGKLIREPARDFEEFVNVHRELIKNEFGETRALRQPHGLFIAPLLHISPWESLIHIQRTWTAPLERADGQAKRISFQPADQKTIDVNLHVIQALGREVKRAGGQLIIIDASNYFHYLRWENLSQTLKSFCADEGFGWIPLGDELLSAEDKGVVTRWPYDQHFNEKGNAMFADAMYRWLADRPGAN